MPNHQQIEGGGFEKKDGFLQEWVLEKQAFRKVKTAKLQYNWKCNLTNKLAKHLSPIIDETLRRTVIPCLIFNQFKCYFGNSFLLGTL